MNNFPINFLPSVRSSFSLLNAASVIPSILQKRVAAVALLVIAGLAIVFSAFLYYTRNRKNVSLKEVDKILPDINPVDISKRKSEQLQALKSDSQSDKLDGQGNPHPFPQQQAKEEQEKVPLSEGHKQTSKHIEPKQTQPGFEILEDDRQEGIDWSESEASKNEKVEAVNGPEQAGASELPDLSDENCFDKDNFEKVVNIFNDPAKEHLRGACRDFFWRAFKTTGFCDTYSRNKYLKINPELTQAKELRELIKQWSQEKKEDEESFYANLLDLLRTIEISQTKELLGHLSLEADIEIEKLITALKDCFFPSETIIPYLYGAQILEILSAIKNDESQEAAEALEDKIAKLINDSLNGSYREPDKDEYRLVAAFLAENCAPDHLPILIRSFLKVKGLKNEFSVYIPECRLTESLLLTLLNQDPKNLEKIRPAFREYWTSWKSFDQGFPPCSLVILPAIQSEDVLNAVIPPLDVDKRVEILRLLRETTVYNDYKSPKKFKLSLPQEVIERNIPPLEFNDYLSYLVEVFEEHKTPTFDRRAQHQFELVFNGLSVEQIEGFTKFILKDIQDVEDLSDDSSVDEDLSDDSFVDEDLSEIADEWPLIQFLISYGVTEATKCDKILEIALLRLQNAAVLDMLFKSVKTPVCKRLTIDQAKKLIGHWASQDPEGYKKFYYSGWERDFFEKIVPFLKALHKEKSQPIIDNFFADFQIELPKEIVDKIFPPS